MELEKLCSTEIISKFPGDAKALAGARSISKNGSAIRIRELTVEKVENTKEKRREEK